MKKTALNLLILLVVVGITFGATRTWFPKVEDNTVVDTVKVSHPYIVEKIVEKTKPVRITEYKRDTVRVESVRVQKDTVFVNNTPFSGEFLLNYPSSPRFLGLTFENPDLELTYQKPSGIVRSKRWNVGDKGYEIGLNDGQPNIRTFKQNKTEFSHSIEAGYIRFFKYGSPYLQLNSEFTILNIEATATINANQNPFGQIGVKYTF